MDLVISAVTHRTGSTLLQRIFNVRKKTLIWGEHDGCLKDFYNIYRKARHYSVDLSNQREKYFNNNEDPNCWIACMIPDIEFLDKALVKGIKSFFKHLYLQYPGDHDIIGFKEVRYGKKELELIRRCYPKANIILLIRNPIDVWKSMVGAGLGNNINYMIKKWNKNGEDYLDISQSDPHSHIITYENLINKEYSTISKIKKIGKITTDDIYRVLDHKLVSTSKEISKKEEQMILNKCKSTMKKYNYL